MGVPTNEELYANAPDNAWDAVRSWVARHAAPYPTSDVWLNWATANFFADPEIRGAFEKEFGITWQV